MARATAVRTSGSVVASYQVIHVVAAARLLKRARSLAGSTCSSLARARTDASSIPASALPATVRRPDDDRDRLVVVEQQRRYGAPSDESIAAVGTHRSGDRIAQVAKAFDVAPDRAPADLEPLREDAPRPDPRRLEEREQGQQPRRGAHDTQYRFM